MKITAIDKQTGERIEIIDLYWFEENHVHSFTDSDWMFEIVIEPLPQIYLLGATERERLIKKLSDSMEQDNAQLFVDRVIAEALSWPLCGDCEGEGEVLDAPNNVLEGRAYWSTCSICKGIGRIQLGIGGKQ